MIIDQLKLVGRLQVGEGASASAEYALHGVNTVERYTPVAAEGVAAHVGVQHEWELSGMAAALSASAVPALIAQMRAELAVVGRRVRLTEFDGFPASAVRDLPAPGGNSGSLAGSPRCELTVGDVIGPYVLFTLRATATIPVLGALSGGFNLVSHTYTISTRTSPAGVTTTSRQGQVRVAPNQVARTYAQDVVITPARTAATNAGKGFDSTVTDGPDASVCTYSYTESVSSSSSVPDVFDVSVVDSVAKDRSGRSTRTIRGYATGPGASGYATGLRPAGSGLVLVTRDRVSQPGLPDGRVEFEYETMTGVADARFSGGVIVSFSQTIQQTAGGRDAVPIEYFDAAPLFKLGAQRLYVYSETTSIEFIGLSFAQALTKTLLAARLSESGLLFVPRPVMTSSSGIRRLTIVRSYGFASAVDPLPEPLEVTGL